LARQLSVAIGLTEALVERTVAMMKIANVAVCVFIASCAFG
jgi:hypothetical protein